MALMMRSLRSWTPIRARLLSSSGASAPPASDEGDDDAEKQQHSLVAGLRSSELLGNRMACIYCPAPTAMQQDTRPEQSLWILKFDPTNKWGNPLMGWTSTRDPLGSIRLKFDSKQSAIDYANAQGLKFRVEEAHLKRHEPKSYSTNFKWKGKP